MNRIDRRTRFAAFLLFIAIIASAVVAFERVRVEQATRHVEIAMDYNDFITLARSYDDNPLVLLRRLHAAGVTSLALTEELGSQLSNSTSRSGYAISGLSLLDAAKLSPISDPTLARIAAAGKIDTGAVYLEAFDRASFDRYMQQLPLRFNSSAISVLHDAPPYIIQVRTQLDYFNSTGLGIPNAQVQRARKLGFFIIPRFQNDEQFSGADIAAMFDDLHAGNRLSTVIFFGLRNQIVGYPKHLADTAAAFKARKYMNYGEIETYDASQVQKGNVALAKMIPGRTVRVQAVSKTEADKLTVPQIAARYELGVRERNVRVVYLRPIVHQYNGLSIENSNIELVKLLAADLREGGFTLGRATPIPLYRGNSRILVGLAALAIPSLFVLLLGFYGWYRPVWAVAAYAATIGVYVGGVAAHHDLLARSIVALAGALLFATAAFSLLSPAFREEPSERFGLQILKSLRWTLAATGVALLGALIVVGLMSSPLIMEEVAPFRGVKLVEGAPPLIALALYLFTRRFNAGARGVRETFESPIRVYQLILAALVIGLGLLVLMRSGNTSDIAPSSFELAIRHHLTQLLSVRPRFKEFIVGFPLLMLMPALRIAHRRVAGVLLALGIGLGIGDIIDTFSHLHTPLLISLLRVVNGFIIGAIVGAVLIAAYGAVVRSTAREEVAGLPVEI